MKSLFISLTALLFACSAYAQHAEEPEFEFEPYVANLADSTLGKMLPLENTYSKAKAGASVYLVGVGKVKSYWYVDGAESSLALQKNTSVIINTGGVSPMQSLTIHKMEKMGKKRRYQSGEVGTFTGATAGKDQSEAFKYKKYGKSSVLIPLNTLEPGEYCLSITNMMTNSKSAKVYTFSIVDESAGDVKQNDRKKDNNSWNQYE